MRNIFFCEDPWLRNDPRNRVCLYHMFLKISIKVILYIYIKNIYIIYIFPNVSQAIYWNVSQTKHGEHTSTNARRRPCAARALCVWIETTLQFLMSNHEPIHHMQNISFELIRTIHMFAVFCCPGLIEPQRWCQCHHHVDQHLEVMFFVLSWYPTHSETNPRNAQLVSLPIVSMQTSEISQEV